ncbi:hypothetical protein BCR33DRAFT_510985 [Rhizoclosmatium globosum]|uniref:Uncharacterized protein n=1 Tax=Rhizoclosmatium globosum TaxID=329046 RepID=A0A1Y2BJY9_9FUNG|nr:hypothetical protein BCR33DRAFT_510985 [Rhizoclosmatium globosum]|eukprot:ORY34425.1 hypothetical protein BCR33DRAFT_510985 [Rhizoclosmatium globosum]
MNASIPSTIFQLARSISRLISSGFNSSRSLAFDAPCNYHSGIIYTSHVQFESVELLYFTAGSNTSNSTNSIPRSANEYYFLEWGDSLLNVLFLNFFVDYDKVVTSVASFLLFGIFYCSLSRCKKGAQHLSDLKFEIHSFGFLAHERLQL